MPTAPAIIGCYLEYLVETEGKSLATARNRLAAIAADHRLGKHHDPVKDPWSRPRSIASLVLQSHMS